MKFFIKNTTMVLLIWSITQCTVTPIENEPLNGNTPCFENDVLPLLVSRCSSPGCHNSKDREEGIDLTSYGEILKTINSGNPEKSELVEYLYETGEDAMPPFPLEPLSDQQIEILVSWIEAGAPYQTSCLSNFNCDSTGMVSFSQDVLPVIDKYCYGCHSDADPQGNYSYTSYESTLKSVRDGTLIGSIHFKNGYVGMPYETNKMPACEISLIERWVDQGTLNN